MTIQYKEYRGGLILPSLLVGDESQKFRFLKNLFQTLVKQPKLCETFLSGCYNITPPVEPPMDKNYVLFVDETGAGKVMTISEEGASHTCMLDHEGRAFVIQESSELGLIVYGIVFYTKD